MTAPITVWLGDASPQRSLHSLDDRTNRRARPAAAFDRPGGSMTAPITPPVAVWLGPQRSISQGVG